MLQDFVAAEFPKEQRLLRKVWAAGSDGRKDRLTREYTTRSNIRRAVILVKAFDQTAILEKRVALLNGRFTAQLD